MKLWPGRLRPWHCLALIFIAVWAAYFNALDNGTVAFDDEVLLSSNELNIGVGGLRGLRHDLETQPGWTLRNILRYRSLRDLSFSADRAMFGEEPWGYHLTNVVLHWLASSAAFLAASSILGSGAAGLAAGLAFALHPVQTESVTYIAGRRDVLSGFLCLAAFYAWILAGSGRRRSLAAAACLWLAALSAKQSAVILPLLVWGHRRLLGGARAQGQPQTAWMTIPMLLVLACAVAVGVDMFHGLRGRPEDRGYLWYGGSMAAQWSTEPRVLFHALRLIVWPWRLSADYSLAAFEPSRSWLDPRTLASAAALAALAGACWVRRTRDPLIAFSIFWTCAAYLPMLPVLPMEHNLEVFAEHWLYLSVFGPALLAGCAFRHLLTRHRAAAVTLLALAALAGGLRTASRNRDWKDALSLWSRTVEDSPRCARALAGLAAAKGRAMDLAGVEDILKRSLEIDPTKAMPYVNLAIYYMHVNDSAAAHSTLDRALRSLPEPERAGLWHLQGMLLLNEGRIPEALTSFSNCSGARNVRHHCLYGQAICHAMNGELAQAQSLLEEVSARYPEATAAQMDLGMLLVRQGRFAQAIPPLERALSLREDSPAAHIALGTALAETGRFAEADVNIRRAVRLAPGLASARRALARLNRLWGFPGRAVRFAELAVSLDGSRESHGELEAARHAASAEGIRHRRQP